MDVASGEVEQRLLPEGMSSEKALYEGIWMCWIGAGSMHLYDPFKYPVKCWLLFGQTVGKVEFVG